MSPSRTLPLWASSPEGRPVSTGRPSLWWGLLACVLLAWSATGCSALRGDRGEARDRPSQARIEASLDALREASTTRERRAAAVDLLARSGLTPIAGGAAPNDVRRYTLDASSARVGGFVPGRHPVLRGELVTVQAPLGAPDAGLLLEAARVLVARSETENRPDRSLLVAFSTDPAAQPRATAATLWPRAAVFARVTLGANRADVSLTDGRAAKAPPPTSTPTVRSANALVDYLLALTSMAPSDTLHALPANTGSLRP